MRRGTQIAYIPNHADGNINHPDVEFGFVTSESEKYNAHFCRYWRRGTNELRTKSNSELTPDEFLVEHNSVAQFVINELLGTMK